jgi:hypothetical protein
MHHTSRSPIRLTSYAAVETCAVQITHNTPTERLGKRLSWVSIDDNNHGTIAHQQNQDTSAVTDVPIVLWILVLALVFVSMPIVMAWAIIGASCHMKSVSRLSVHGVSDVRVHVLVKTGTLVTLTNVQATAKNRVTGNMERGSHDLFFAVFLA